MKFLLLALLWCAPILAQSAANKPKLVVAITIDQFRYDYLTRFRDQYNGGLDRLLRNGAVFTNAFYEHFPTVTAVGHSTYLSGATPSVSGIIANEWYDRETGKQVTSVTDAKVSMLGGASRGAGGAAASPRRMLVSTVGDELKMAGRGSKVVGVSVKDRSAILPAGHMANGAYWFDPGSGNFVSSTFYFDALPGWVSDFNKTRFVDRFLAAKWTPFGGGTALFKTMPEAAGKDYYNGLESSPYGNEIVQKFAEAAVIGEQLGRRNTTDVLAVSFSSNDYIGHNVGPDGPEVRDISIRTDRMLADFFKFLDAQVGMRNVVVVVTADHGVSPVPEVNKGRHMPGGRMTEKSISEAIQKSLASRYGDGKWIVGNSSASQYLDHGLIRSKKLSLDEVSETAAEAVRELPHIFRVYTRGQLAKGMVPGDAMDRRILNGFHHGRAADITVIQEPYYLLQAKGTSHGAPFQYDAHVPVIFMGGWVKSGRYHQRVSPNDIAPTLATLLDVETPSGATGRVLHEILTAPAAATATPRPSASSKP